MGNAVDDKAIEAGAERGVAHALNLSRSGHAHWINGLRVAVAAALSVAYWLNARVLGNPLWVGTDLVLFGYLALAAGAAIAGRSSPRFARASGYLLPSLDLVAGTLTQLTLIAHGADPDSVVGFDLAAFVLVVLGCQLWSSYRLLAVTTAAAVSAQVGLHFTVGSNPGELLAACAMLATAGAVVALGIRSQLSVQRALAQEWARERLATSQLAFARANLDAVVELLPHCVMVHRHGVLLSANAAARSLLRLGPTLPARLGDVTEEVAFEAGPAHEGHLRRADGQKVLVEFAHVRLALADGPAVLTLARDLTERRELEEQTLLFDRLATIGTVAAGIAHEINNPLAVIQSAVKYLAEQPAAHHDPEQRELVDDLALATERLIAIVKELKVLSHKDTHEQTPIQLADVVDGCLRLVNHQLKGRALVSREVGPSPVVLGNETRLSQVLTNLLVNASQAIVQGDAGRNRITVRVGTSPAGEATLEVADTGAGMTPEVRKRLFEPFFTTKPRGVGTGLGLAICKRIVAELQGRIEVDSELGKGTTFRVLLPAFALK